ncbi:hypothetical protein [Sorangium sp. So ce887]|uniref:hypothetical protein n=1 Tax=Sorangium sp. So ce887 TaxID=3133324 RepID=UPI003F5E74CD
MWSRASRGRDGSGWIDVRGEDAKKGGVGQGGGGGRRGGISVEGVTFELGPPGKGGISWDQEGNMITGDDGVAVETFRFPE